MTEQLPSSSEDASLEKLLHQRSTIICIGPGGVGKTTSSAALGAGLAKTGRSVCVVTFDPARRLASALGRTSLPHEPTLITDESFSGSLWACMLDATVTFDAMVLNYAETEEQAERIFANRIYRNLVTNLSGTQEYMALERLWELHSDPRFDIIVIDTPPSAGALDLINAPRHLVSFLDNRLFKLIVKPVPLYLRPVSLAARTLLKSISKVVGSEVVSDALDFFHEFSGIEEGMKARAQQVEELLQSSSTGFVAVTSPRVSALRESQEIIRRLHGSQYNPLGLIVNRMTPEFPFSFEHVPNEPPTSVEPALWSLMQENLHLLRQLREIEIRNLATYLAQGPSLPLLLIDTLATDLTSLDELVKLGETMLFSTLDRANFASDEDSSTIES
ncbi:MAG: ArsA family ATPase [Acidimicrobiales bacterium]